MIFFYISKTLSEFKLHRNEKAPFNISSSKRFLKIVSRQPGDDLTGES
jgi:hypothetical protein